MLSAMMGVIASTVPAAEGGFTDPSDISDLIGWYDADDNSTILEADDSTAEADDPVKTLIDKSTAGNDLTQATSTKRPLYKTNIQNGKPGILFDGVDDFLSVLTSQYGQGNTLCFVFKSNESLGSRYICDGGVGGRHVVYVRPSSSDVNMYAGNDVDTTYDIDTDPHYGVFVFNTANSKAIVDGTDYGTVNVGSASLDDFYLGSRYSDQQYFSGYFFEVCIYSKVLSSSEIDNLESYFATKWGI